MRDEPEGNSIMQKSKFKPRRPAVTQHSMAAASKSKCHKLAASDINLDNMEDKYLMKKAKKVDISQTCTFNSLNFTTSTTVGHSDSMVSQNNASSSSGQNRTRRIDRSWENAVETARGQPDGAERSFRTTRLSTVDEEDELLGGAAKSIEKEEEEVEELQAAEPKKKKSIKAKIKTAARKLRPNSSKGKGGKQSVQTGMRGKRKMEHNNATITDETFKPVTPTKKFKLEEMGRKEKKKMRKMMKNNSELIKSSKNVWEELRRHDLAEERRIELCDILYKHVKGKVKEMVFAHDTARVIQSLLQFGDPDQKQVVFEEMKDQIVPMTKSKYAKFVVRKVIKYGTKHQRNFVLKAFHGNVRKLIRHREAADVVECAYNEYANASQRLALLEEFYGPSFLLFKTFETKCLDDIMLNQPDMKDMILSNMKEALLPLVDKSILVHSLVHRVFFEFFKYANNKMKSDMIEVLREGLVSMLHTRDGSRVAMQCIWYGSTKDRKVIIKSLKTHVVKICKEEYGHMFLLALFDVVDDTRIVRKVIIEEILKSVEEVAEDQYGRKVLIYLLNPRDPLHFHPDIVRVLQEGDKTPASKKDMSTRHKELLEAVSQPLLQYVMEHTKDLVLDNNSLLFLLSVLTHAQGDPSGAMESVAKIAAEPFTAGSLEDVHIVEHRSGHLTLKRLILNDKDRLQQGSAVLFSQVLMKTLPYGSLKSWAACNRGCFILLALLDLEKPEVTALVKEQLAGVKKSLRKMNFKGSQILLQQLDSD